MLQAMIDALESGRFEDLAKLAHWLKGSGGTLGFNDFTEPAAELEQAAKRESLEDSRAHLNAIGNLVSRTEPAQKQSNTRRCVRGMVRSCENRLPSYGPESILLSRVSVRRLAVWARVYLSDSSPRHNPGACRSFCFSIRRKHRFPGDPVAPDYQCH